MFRGYGAPVLTNTEYFLDFPVGRKACKPQHGRTTSMPTYEYRCEKCAKTFSVSMSIADHDKGGATCPECKGRSVVQQYTAFYAKTSKKS
jgi:putative FmdB family regulatory protein